MTARKNPFPGVTRITDRHGKTRWRFRSKGATTYRPGPYGSVAFRAAYEAAKEGAKAPQRSTTPQGTLAWLIEQYLASPKFHNLSDSRKRSIRGELDWLRTVEGAGNLPAGDLPFTRLGTRHVEALMGMKTGPTAANTVKKNLSMLFNFAIKREMGITFNPARFADRRKENADGYYTWTDQDIARFKDRHPTGSKPRLALMLFLWTGASRQDVAAMGWGNVQGDRISYRRGKTGVGADLPIHPELAAELAQVPRDQFLFVTHGNGLAYKPTTLGNWFKDQCTAAGTDPRCSAHGLRKSLATLMANAGKSPDEIRAVLAHKTNKEGATYTKKADRSRLADSGFMGLSSTEPEQTLPNLPVRLAKSNPQRIVTKGKK